MQLPNRLSAVVCVLSLCACTPKGTPLLPAAGLGGGTAQPTPTAGVGVVAAGGAGSASPLAGSAAGATAATGDIPCAVAALLELHCMECHAHQPRLGAPMSLTEAALFQAQRSGFSVAALVSMRVQSAERPMPPNMLLTASEAAPLLQWVNAGAAPVANGCRVRDPFEMPAAGAGASGSGGANAVAGQSAGGSGGQSGDATQGQGDWVMFGGDLGNQRANPNETAIGVQNVSQLKELWTFRGASNTSTPAIVGGVVYLSTWDGKVHALDAQTGKELWMTALPDLIDSSPAVSDTQVFVSDDNGSVHALERSKGTKQWSKVVDPHAEAHLWSSPIYIASAGLLVVGIASGEEQVQPPYSFRGSVVGLDAKTGAERWRFYTTTNDTASGPGVGVWATAAVDEKRRLAIIGTGNAYSGTAGKYADSLLALNYESGQLAWSKQFTAGDVFSIFGALGPDYDLGASANLFSIAGKDVIGIGIKSGDYAVLERDTGAMLWNAHVGGMGSMGGILGSPAYAENKIFIASNTYPAPQSVTVAALGAEKGDTLWKQTLTGGLTYGGVLYANGVVYVGTTTSAIVAYEAATGKQLWTTKAPDAIAGGPSIAQGRLFVPWGYTWTLREGNAGTGGLTAYGLK
jgi:polyvinyl alcohol dehydrogenase (cytochrome)